MKQSPPLCSSFQIRFLLTFLLVVILKCRAQQIAFITAAFGTYERRVRRPRNQTVNADFVCFSDNAALVHDGWILDKTPYHVTHPNPIDDGNKHNSLNKNTHPFNIAKYYKQSFHLIPRLSQYDVIVWIDATIEIEYAETASWLLERVIAQRHPAVGWAHGVRRGYLAEEAYVAFKYAPKKYSTNGSYWMGSWQPPQLTLNQYCEYLNQGYQDRFINNSALNRNFYWDTVRSIVNTTNNHFGVWLTCFIAFDNKSPLIKRFLDHWYLQTLNYTTEDQVSFPFSAWKFNVTPYTLPDSDTWGDAPEKRTKFYTKHPHGK